MLLELSSPNLTAEARKVLQILDERYGETIERLYSPLCVVLFGSYARGDHDRWSDVDLVVVSAAFADEPPLHRRSQFLINTGLLWEKAFVVEPHCATPEEYRQAINMVTIFQEATRTGIVLLDRENLTERIMLATK